MLNPWLKNSFKMNIMDIYTVYEGNKAAQWIQF